jgi:hypothetical protein
VRNETSQSDSRANHKSPWRVAIIFLMGAGDAVENDRKIVAFDAATSARNRADFFFQRASKLCAGFQALAESTKSRMR